MEYLTSYIEIPYWVFYLMALLTLPALYKIGRRAFVLVMRHVFRKELEYSPYALYKSDVFFNALWHWNYQKGKPSDVRCECPECHTDLIWESAGNNVYLQCETCDKVIFKTEGWDNRNLLEMAKRQIERRIKTGEWENAVKEARKEGSSDSSSQ